MKRFVRWLARQKTVLGYASTIVNMPLLGYLTAAKLHEQLAFSGINIPTAVILFCLVLILWGVGWAFFALGLPQAEMEYTWQINPEWHKMSKDKPKHSECKIPKRRVKVK